MQYRAKQSQCSNGVFREQHAKTNTDLTCYSTDSCDISEKLAFLTAEIKTKEDNISQRSNSNKGFRIHYTCFDYLFSFH